MDEKLLNNIRTIAGSYGLKRLVLFGSAIESLDSARDVDIACEGLSGKKFLRFGAELEDIFNKTVDLIQIEERSKFIELILKKGIVIYES